MEGLGNDCYLEVVVNQQLGGDVQPTMAISAGVLTMPRSIWPFGNA